MARSPEAKNDLKSYTIPNLVQGVSQQAVEQRRDTQAEEQFDCFNSPVDGVSARPPFEIVGLIPSLDFQDCYAKAIARGSSEHYLAIFSADTTHECRVYNLNTGAACTVTYTDGESYIETVGGARDNIRACTLEDTTFVVNREEEPIMDPIAVADEGYNEGIIYFKAGGYKITFQVVIRYNGNAYSFRYESPDNSAAGNAAYITTNQLAATFYRAFTGGVASTITSGNALVTPDRSASAATSDGGGVGAADAGQTGVVGAITLTSLGFYVALNGNVILVGRADDNEFTIDVSDGVGDTYLRCAKNNVQSFSDLPKSCFSGFTTMVRGTNKQAADDYWVTFNGEDGQGGYWEETVKPGIEIDFLAATMPHLLVNTGANTFEWKFRRPVIHRYPHPGPVLQQRPPGDHDRGDRGVGPQQAALCVLSRQRPDHPGHRPGGHSGRRRQGDCPTAEPRPDRGQHVPLGGGHPVPHQ
jgi:hypothetical protein